MLSALTVNRILPALCSPRDHDHVLLEPSHSSPRLCQTRMSTLGVCSALSRWPGLPAPHRAPPVVPIVQPFTENEFICLTQQQSMPMACPARTRPSPYLLHASNGSSLRPWEKEWRAFHRSGFSAQYKGSDLKSNPQFVGGIGVPKVGDTRRREIFPRPHRRVRGSERFKVAFQTRPLQTVIRTEDYSGSFPICLAGHLHLP